MLKNWFTRLSRIASGTFGSAKEDGFTLEASLTKFERFMHFWVLVWQSFVRNRCPVRASALSYTTMVAFIPILAVAVSITNAILQSKGEEQIKQFIEQFVDKVAGTAAKNPTNAVPETPGLNQTSTGVTNIENLTANFSHQLEQIQFDITLARSALAGSNSPVPSNGVGQIHLFDANTNSASSSTNSLEANVTAGETHLKKSVAHDAANYIYQFAAKSNSTTLGVTGMIFLILTAIMTLTRVEETFNDMWGVTRGRDWWSRITNYFFTIALGPVLIIGALGLANSPNFQKTRDLINLLPFLEPLLKNYLPVVIVCFTFALLYKIVPNTKVDFGAALVGGSLAGIGWHFYTHLGFLLASQAVNANKIYGSLFILPLMMGGLYVAWLTVLFGAQVAYAFQNRASYLQERLAENVNQRGREFVALRLMTCIGQRFDRGLPPVTIRDISAELGVPGKLAQQVMRTLLAAGLVVEITGVEAGYAPARPLETINCHHILVAMRATHGQEPATRDEPVRVEVLGEFARIQAAEKEAASSVTMLALVNRARARLELAAPAVVSNDVALPTGRATAVVTLAPEVAQSVAQPPSVKFGETTPATPNVAATNWDAESPRDEVKSIASQPASPKSISSPSPAVTTNENESFPL